jgi:hypothetical protein
MVQVNNLENCQVSENPSKSIRDNCNLDYRELMSGQSFNNFSKCNDRNAMVAGCLPAMEIVDNSRRYPSDTQEAARLSKVLHSGSLLQELDIAKTGKHDGKISKNDLDIYLRMHPQDTPQTRAVEEMRAAWDDKHHPSHNAVKLLRAELAHERKEIKGGGEHDLGRNSLGLERMPLPTPIRRDQREVEGRSGTGNSGEGSSNQPERRSPVRPEQRQERAPECYEPRNKPEAPKDIKEAGQVRPGEGYYQVAMRMIETTGHKPSHKETMELVQALRTANDNKTVLTVHDNLSTLLDKQLPGNQGKVKDHRRKSH